MSTPPPRRPAEFHSRQPIAAEGDARTLVAPPNKHELALMIWMAVFPTLTALNLTLGPWLARLNPVLRTFTLVTIAVPMVIYGLMPRLHATRARLMTRRTA